MSHIFHTIKPLKPKRKMLYLKTQSVPRCKHFSSGYKNESVYAVSGTSRCLFWDKYKTNTVWAECQVLSFKPVGARDQ